MISCTIQQDVPKSHDYVKQYGRDSTQIKNVQSLQAAQFEQSLQSSHALQFVQQMPVKVGSMNELATQYSKI
jgi:hypothetical protein